MSPIKRKGIILAGGSGMRNSLLDTTGFIATLQKRQGLMVVCPEEIAYRQGSMSAQVSQQLSRNSYGQYLTQILHESGVFA